MADGNGILGHLFGSKDLSRAVAAQAAQATGIGQQILQQMLPAIAAMIMGGLFKQSTNQMQARRVRPQPSNPLGEIIERDDAAGRRHGGGARPAAPQPDRRTNPFDNPFGKVLQDMFGGGAAGHPAGQAPGSRSRLWRQSVRQDLRGHAAAIASRRPTRSPLRKPSRASATIRAGRPRNPYDDIFGKMFETGRQQRDDYQKGVESIFDQFKKGMDR